ncbi:CAAX protease self-immunity [Candidatus Fervidibacteria bacterium JGI MDM2 SSWTFF-3-K9]
MGQWYNSLVVAVSGILLTLACYYAPYNQHTHWFHWCMWGFLCGFLFPLGVAISLGLRWRDLGLSVGDWAFGGIFVLVGLVVMTAFGLWAAKQPDFQAYYALIAIQHQNSPLLFWVSLLAYMTGWEFLFRGFLLFGISGMPERVEIFPSTWKAWFAIGFSTLLFGLSHWGKPLPEFLGSFVAGIILCLVAWRTRSCLAPILLHTLVFGMFVVFVL